MQDVYGHRVVKWRKLSCPYRVVQWLPRFGEKCYRVVKGDIWFVVHWKQRGGCWIRSGGRNSLSTTIPLYHYPRVQEYSMKRRSAPQGGPAIVQAIPSASTLWPKLPALREFLHATAYEDGSARQPGYVTFRNKVTTIEVTVYDPDSGTRLPCRGATLDQALSLLEQLLGVEEAPWEADKYLMEQLVAKSKRRR